MSETGSNSTYASGSVDWLLGIRFFLLTFTIAGVLSSAVTVSWWAQLALDHWRAFRAFIRESAVSLLGTWFDVHLHWFIIEQLPTDTVLYAVIALGLLRINQVRQRIRSTLGYSHGRFWYHRVHGLQQAAALALALVLMVTMAFLNRSHSDAPSTPQAWRAYYAECSAPFLNERCVEMRKRLPGSGNRYAEYTPIDWTLHTAALVAFVAVALIFPFEIIAAFVAACLFLGLGMMDLRHLMGPT